jgi:hypothetical protein
MSGPPQTTILQGPFLTTAAVRRLPLRNMFSVGIEH